MQRLTLVRYATKPDRAEENQALSLAVFNEMKAAKPDHVAYLLFRQGVDFIHLFVNLRDDDASALVELPAFKAYSKDIGDRAAAQPEITRLEATLLASYGV